MLVAGGGERGEENSLLYRNTKQKICYSAEISLQGEKYLDEQIENAINGIKEMKSVMQKSSQDHQRYLDDLEKTKQQKEVWTWCQISATTSTMRLFLYIVEFPNNVFFTH